VPLGTAVLPERYRDPKLVAHGGMGAVYCAVDALLDRTVAVKVLDGRYAADAEIRGRFLREARAAARLSGDANAVTIYDVGEWEGRPFIVMEYVAGGSLAEVIARGTPPAAQTITWLQQAARALDRAHARGIVHRDVKPANLLLDRSGVVHVTDFGVASAAGLESLTQTGTVLGTAGYLAPEQALGQPTSPATDEYALAVVAFELLTGSRPFSADSIAADAAAHVHAPVPSVFERAGEVPAQCDAVFRRALAKEPGERYPTCDAFVRALRAAYHDAGATTRVLPSPARPAPARDERLLHRPRRRRRAPAVAALLVVAGVAAGIGTAVLVTRDGSHPARVAVTVTAKGRTATAQARPPTTGAASTRAPAPTGSSGRTLALEGYSRMRAGDYTGALPLLEQAAGRLRGSGSIDEAYNDYNLAVALAKTDGCSARVTELLAASERIQGHRSEIDALRRTCSG
jgi:serine/threonine-protein kinase